jgi:hypothetical protein
LTVGFSHSFLEGVSNARFSVATSKGGSLRACLLDIQTDELSKLANVMMKKAMKEVPQENGEGRRGEERRGEEDTSGPTD